MSYYKDGYFWRNPTPAWAIKEFGQTADGKGDLVTITMGKIIDDCDYSEWAYKALEACGDLLMRGERWPDRMCHEKDAKNLLGFWVTHWLFDFGLRKERKYRPQRPNTRDPWIRFMVCAFRLNRFQLFHLKVTPWWIYRPNVWRWLKFLRTENPVYKKRYLRFLRPNKREWVNKLHYYINMTL